VVGVTPRFRSAGHRGSLAARTLSQILGQTFETKTSLPEEGRPLLQIRRLVRQMAIANPLWHAPRIHGELKMLGIPISERTVSRILRSVPRPPSQTWKTFLRNHLGQIVSVDFFTVPTIRLRVRVRIPGSGAWSRRGAPLQRYRTPNFRPASHSRWSRLSPTANHLVI